MLWVNLLTYIAFGDLNGDGLPDAAVFLAENGGGTGVFVSLVVVINQAGQPVQAGSVFIDDRPIIAGVEIVDGKIGVTATIHGNQRPRLLPRPAGAADLCPGGRQPHPDPPDLHLPQRRIARHLYHQPALRQPGWYAGADPGEHAGRPV